jgi:hypothetical protein
MTWRPSDYLLEGELDNRRPGKITGWLRFAGLPEKVIVDLDGDFEPDIRGQRIGLTGPRFCNLSAAAQYMNGFALKQSGQAGHITAGWPPQSWTDFPCVEWSSTENDRVVMYLEPHQVAVLDEPAEAATAEPGWV